MHEGLIVASITFVITFFGTGSNLLVLICAQHLSSMNSSFGIITKSQAVCNMGMCLVYLLYVFPMQLSGSPTYLKYSHFFGTTAMSVDEVSNLSHLLIASNRFCAVFLSAHYEKVFSKFGTKIMRNVIWIVSVLFCVLLYEIIGCHLLYDEVSWTLIFIPTPKCTTLTWYSDFTLNMSLVGTTVLLNLVTAYKAGRNSRMLMDAAGVKMSKKQRQRELSFIRQTFFQGLTVFFGQITYYLVAPLLKNPILLFFFASLWAFVHAFEGGIILGSNQEMREIVLRKRKSWFFCILPAYSPRLQDPPQWPSPLSLPVDDELPRVSASRRKQQHKGALRRSGNRARFGKMQGQQLVGLTILPLCLVGVVCNWLVFSASFHIRSFSPSFALLTGSLALFDALFSMVYLEYVGPMIVLNLKSLKMWSSECDFVLMVLYDAAMEMHSVISLNRFFAVFTPIFYRRLFSVNATRIYILICVTISFANYFVYNFTVGCKMMYDDAIWMFYIDESSLVCVTYSYVIDFAKNLSIACFDAFIDIITIVKVYATRRKIQKTQKSQSIRRKELDFLKQTCVQGVFSIFVLSIYYFVPEFVTNMYLSFMLTTFLWPALSTVDGVAVLVYNSEVRAGVFRRKEMANSSTVSVSDRKTSQKM